MFKKLFGNKIDHKALQKEHEKELLNVFLNEDIDYRFLNKNETNLYKKLVIENEGALFVEAVFKIHSHKIKVMQGGILYFTTEKFYFINTKENILESSTWEDVESVEKDNYKYLLITTKNNIYRYDARNVDYFVNVYKAIEQEIKNNGVHDEFKEIIDDKQPIETKVNEKYIKDESYLDSRFNLSNYNSYINRDLIIADIILLWWYSVKTKVDTFPVYFKQRYEIDPQKRTQHLIHKGYLDKSDPLTYIHQLKNDDLKKILKKHKLKVSGKKEELLKRIQNELSFEELYKLPNNDKLIPTEDGYELLKQYKHVYYGHQHLNEYVTPCTMKDMYDKMHRLTGTYYMPGDIEFSIYEEAYEHEALRHFKYRVNNISTLRRINLHRYQQLYREKNYDTAIHFLFSVLIYDTCKRNYGIVDDELFNKLIILLKENNYDKEKISEAIDRSLNSVVFSNKITIEDMNNFYSLFTAYMLYDNEKIIYFKNLIEKHHL